MKFIKKFCTKSSQNRKAIAGVIFAIQDLQDKLEDLDNKFYIHLERFHDDV